ncbi:MAG: hypothetical protein V3V67_09345 [Myxococcota bacterium]
MTTEGLGEAESRISLALFSLRLSVFLVMLMWTLDKFVNWDHTARVYEHFYLIRGLGSGSFYTIGALEMLLLVGFVIGYQKRLTYGAVFLIHGISTLSSYRQYLAGFDNLLFFAAWPMLAACFTLFVLRDMDTRWSVERS